MHSRDYTTDFPVPTSPTYGHYQIVNTYATEKEQVSHAADGKELTGNEDVVEDSDCSLFTFVAYVGVFGSICLFGLIGNSVSWAVLSWERRQRGRVATFLLQTMAIVDNLFLLTAGVSQISVALKVYIYYSQIGTEQMLSNVTDSPISVASDTSVHVRQLDNSIGKTIETAQTPLVLMCREDDTDGIVHVGSSLPLDLVGYRINQTSCLGSHATESWGHNSVLNHSRFDYFGYFLSHITAYVVVGVFPFVHITQMWTVWITVLVAVNRYVAICRPFQASQVCTMKQTKIQIISIGLAIFIYCLPRFFEYQIVYESDQMMGGMEVPVEVETDIKSNVVYNIVYENLLYCMFVFLGPLLIIAVLNACLVRELIRARRRRRARQFPLISCSYSGSRNCCSTAGGGGGNVGTSCGNSRGDGGGESNLTLVMIVIVLIFVVCQTPAFANQVLYHWLEDEYACGKIYYYYYHVSNLVVSANSAINFVVYCVFRRQFRHRLRACFRCQRPARGSVLYYQSAIGSAFVNGFVGGGAGAMAAAADAVARSSGRRSTAVGDAMHFPLRVIVPTANCGNSTGGVS